MAIAGARRPAELAGRWAEKILAIGLGGAALALPASGPPPRPVVTAGATTSAILVDGDLSEPAWANAGIILDLTQQSPKPGQPTPYRTEVRVLKDADTLYFGITCEDPRPESISIHTLQRDANLSSDDNVTLVFDTFGDGRKGYYFQINAAGARRDGLIAGPDDVSKDWDGIWDAKTKRFAHGWTAEVVLPSKTLRFASGKEAWGFNVERYVARERLTLRWADPSLDASLWDLRRDGILQIPSGLQQGLGLSVSPYWKGDLTSGADYPKQTLAGKAGADVLFNMTSNLAAILTLNTDFAETEVDTRQINLTRFPLYYPEKRAFFLEGSNQFDFGLGLGTNFIPFYSRQVGLYQGAQVPIDAGLKAIGQAGPWGIGVLATRMGEGGGAQATNLEVARFTYDVDQHLRLGAIGTNGSPDGLSKNTLAGVDAVWRTSTLFGDKNFQAGLWGARSGGEVRPGSRTGWGFKVDYPNDLWDVYAQMNTFGDALQPGLGFLPRPGTRQYDMYGAYQPRPQGGAFSWVRQFYFELEYYRVEGLDGMVQSWEVFTAPFNATTESGWHLECNFAPRYEFLSQPFEVVPGVTIPTGAYRFNRYRAEFQSPSTNPWRVGATVWVGGYYSGRLTQVETFVTLTNFSGRLQQTLDLENDYGYLPQGDFIQRAWQYKVLYAFNPNMYLSAYFQYDTDSHQMGMDARFVWTVKPGNDIFLVWDRNWQHPLDASPFSLSYRSDQLALKVRWTFR